MGLTRGRGFSFIDNSGSTNDSSNVGSATNFVDHTPVCPLPANFFDAKRTLLVEAHWRLTTGTGTPALGYRLRLGSAIIVESVTGSTMNVFASLSDRSFAHQYLIQAVDPPGGTANMLAAFVGVVNSSISGTAHSTIAQPVAVATNGALNLTLATRWSALGTGTHAITLAQLVVKEVK